MKKLIIFALMAILSTVAFAQVNIDTKTISIFPYFEKNDTMIYYRQHAAFTVTGSDTLITTNNYERFMVVCTKANEKKGYRIEETPLEAQDFIKSPKGEMADKMKEVFTKATIGKTFVFTIDNMGDNLKLENPEKTVKMLRTSVETSWDSLAKEVPLITTILPKTAMVAMADNILSHSSNEQLFPEINQLFEFHASTYNLGDTIEQEIAKDGCMTKPGKLTITTNAMPEDGDSIATWDDYCLRISGLTCQDAAEAAVERYSAMGQTVTKEQVKQLLGDKMPTGEIEVQEDYVNVYFGEGWPKNLLYEKAIKQGDSITYDISTIEWEYHSVNNGK